MHFLIIFHSEGALQIFCQIMASKQKQKEAAEKRTYCQMAFPTEAYAKVRL
jgi:hypothetical protein